jgi:hypothetical protein
VQPCIVGETCEICGSALLAAGPSGGRLTRATGYQLIPCRNGVTGEFEVFACRSEGRAGLLSLDELSGTLGGRCTRPGARAGWVAVRRVY